MEKILILLIIILFAFAGCKDGEKRNQYLPEAKNDKIYTIVGGGD